MADVKRRSKVDGPHGTTAGTAASAKTKGYNENSSIAGKGVEILTENLKRKLNISPKQCETETTEVDTTKGQELLSQTKKWPVVQVKIINDGQMKQRLEKQLGFPLALTPSLEIIEYLGVRKQFGNVPDTMKIDLRTAEQIKQGSAIQLPQFDPNFFSPHQIHCRYSSCTETKPRSSKDPLKTTKEDLYLCPDHRQEMVKTVDFAIKKYAKKEITVDFEDSKNVDFNGYTSLIGLMEKAYQQFKEKASKEKASPTHASSVQVDSLLAEIYLNLRNFFIITNVLLNPDWDNLRSSLFPVISLLQSLLNQCNSREFVENLCHLLREVVQIILQFFGIVYTWVCQTVLGNSYGQIGAGLGMAAGAIAAGAAFGPVFPLIALGAVIGSMSGGLIGTGIFNRNRSYQYSVYRFQGDFDGNLNMSTP